MADRDRGDGPSLFDLPLSPEDGPRREREGKEREAGERKAEEREGGGRPGVDRGAKEPAAKEPGNGGSGRPGSDGETAAAPSGGTGDGRQRGGRELPLFGDEDGTATRPRKPSEPPAWEPVPELPEPEPSAPPEEDDEAAGESRRRARPARFSARLTAALLDAGILLAAAATAVLGAFLLGVGWSEDDLGGLAALLLVFSFVYSVVPLAFWGRTPGMALAGVIARGADGGPLTFGQTGLRWLGGLLTLLLAGLPLLLALPALGDRSLADRLSGSRTWTVVSGTARDDGEAEPGDPPAHDLPV